MKIKRLHHRAHRVHRDFWGGFAGFVFNQNNPEKHTSFSYGNHNPLSVCSVISVVNDYKK